MKAWIWIFAALATTPVFAADPLVMMEDALTGQKVFLLDLPGTSDVIRAWSVDVDFAAEIDLEKIRLGDAAYVEPLWEKLQEHAQNFLVDYHARHIVTQFDEEGLSCIQAAGMTTNHCGFALHYDRRSHLAIATHESRWSTDRLGVFRLLQGPDGLTVAARFEEKALDQVKDDALKLLDEKLASNAAYVSARNKNELVQTVSFSASRLLDEHDGGYRIELTLATDAYRPKQQDPFSGEQSLRYELHKAPGQNAVSFSLMK